MSAVKCNIQKKGARRQVLGKGRGVWAERERSESLTKAGIKGTGTDKIPGTYYKAQERPWLGSEQQMRNLPHGGNL